MGNDEVICKHCQSQNVRKFGLYKGVQRYYCNDCKRKFKDDNTLFHMKTPPEQISSALNLYYSGTSIREVCEFLEQEHKNKPSKKSVYGWIDKYSDLAIKTAKDYQPSDIGDIWIADETVLSIDGQNVWMYDIMTTRPVICLPHVLQRQGLPVMPNPLWNQLLRKLVKLQR